MRNIFLIGYMGTGKSTVAAFISKEYGLDVMEMDEVLVQQEEMSISDIFRTHGEEYFREVETNLLKEICMLTNQVVSCGGGVVLRSQNIEEMKGCGTIVLLSARPETILERVEGDSSRPLLQGNKNLAFITDMLEQRRPKYEGAADIVVQTDGKSVSNICKEIFDKIERRG